VEPLRALQIFVAVADAGNFSAAARKMGITPAAVSLSVQRFEASMSVRLFHRTTRQLSLSADGQFLYSIARKALAEFDEAMVQLKAGRQELAGPIRLAIAPSFGRIYVLPILREFLVKYPHVTLDLAFYDRATTGSESDFDIAIQRGTGKHVRYLSRKLCGLPFVLVASPSYLERVGTPRDPADLKELNCINIRYAHDQLLVWRLSRRRIAGEEPQKSVQKYVHHPANKIQISEQIDVVLDAPISGLGVAPVALTSALGHLRDGTLAEVLPGWRLDDNLEMSILYPRYRAISQRVKRLAEFLTRELRRNKDLQGIGLANVSAERDTVARGRAARLRQSRQRPS